MLTHDAVKLPPIPSAALYKLRRPTP